jgi:hypothetical protein
VSGGGRPWLDRLLGRRPRRAVWQPVRFGPEFEWLDGNHARLTAGPMKGEVLELAAEFGHTEACFSTYHYGSKIGECHIERKPAGQGIVLWDVGVRENYRRRGLASLLTLVAFRRLLAEQRSATFRIRMVRLIKPSDTDIEFQNVGMGVIAYRLGMESEFDAPRLLGPDNLVGVEIIAPRGDFPPGLKFVIRTDPLVLVGFVLDSDTKRPVSDLGTYVRLMRSQSDLRDWLAKGLVVICNGDFRLREAGVDRFLGCIARDYREARLYGLKVKGL